MPAPSHRLTKTRVYYIWWNMKKRCSLSTTPSFRQYGARGITYDPRWDSLANFVEDMGFPGPDDTLERIDNDGPYTKGNCRWATRKEQARNRRSSRLITMRGKTQCLAAWCEELGLNPRSIMSRLVRGMSEEQALTKPLRKISPRST